jgi:hypothetical protein
MRSKVAVASSNCPDRIKNACASKSKRTEERFKVREKEKERDRERAVSIITFVEVTPG